MTLILTYADNKLLLNVVLLRWNAFLLHMALTSMQQLTHINMTRQLGIVAQTCTNLGNFPLQSRMLLRGVCETQNIMRYMEAVWCFQDQVNEIC